MLGITDEEDGMDEILTVAEIESRFAAEWVLVEDPETNESLDVERGRVRYHSKDRDEVYRKAVELRPSRFAVLYTGQIPEDAAVVLGDLALAEAIREGRKTGIVSRDEVFNVVQGNP